MVLSILLYRCTRWTRIEEKLEGNCTRMLRAILDKSWKQHATQQEIYCHLPPISKTMQIRQTRHMGHCWRSKDELISDLLQWTPLHQRACVGRLWRTYPQQVCTDTGCNLEDRPEAMDEKMNGERESGKYVLAAWPNDEDHHLRKRWILSCYIDCLLFPHIYIYIYIYMTFSF